MNGSVFNDVASAVVVVVVVVDDVITLTDFRGVLFPGDSVIGIDPIRRTMVVSLCGGLGSKECRMVFLSAGHERLWFYLPRLGKNRNIAEFEVIL